MADVVSLFKAFEGGSSAWAYDLNDVKRRMAEVYEGKPRTPADRWAFQAALAMYVPNGTERDVLQNFHALSVVFGEALAEALDKSPEVSQR